MLRYLLSCRAENRGKEKINIEILAKTKYTLYLCNGYNLKSYNYARELFFCNYRTSRFDEVRVKVNKELCELNERRAILYELCQARA